MDLHALQYIFAAIIWVTTLIGNILPLFLTAPRWISRCESLAGGVFLGAGLAHLLDEAYEKLKHYEDEGNEMKYPLAPAVALATYVLLTCVELFSYSEHDANAFKTETTDNEEGASLTSSVANNNYTPLLATDDSAGSESHHESKKMVEFGKNFKSITCTMISLYIIMDIHSAIEGLALGILSKQASVIAIFCAIVGHKPVEAFALSLIILKDMPTAWFYWLLVVIYTLMSPVAVAVGVSCQEISGNLAQCIITAFSAGTFLFVGCHEWSEMFEHKHEWKNPEKLWHFGFFTIGVVWMLLIAIIEMYADD